MKKIKKYIISGIEPGKMGAGLFVSKFIETACQIFPDIIVSYNKTIENKKLKFLKGTKLARFALNTFYFFYKKLHSKSGIRHSEIFLFHPQSIGLENVNRLINNNEIIHFYVLDNFFFCLRSYNYIPNSHIPCFECIPALSENAIEKNNCQAFPQNYSIKEYHEFVDILKQNLHKIRFLTQNINQGELLKKHFGNTILPVFIGMITKEINPTINNKPETLGLESKTFDFVYHNTLSYSKGIEIFIELASIYANNSFLMPYNQRVVQNYLKRDDLPANISFDDCNWDSGLREYVENCKIVLCLSVWSAPVEGALLKSIQHNGCIAVLDMPYSFADELPADVALKLNRNDLTENEILNKYLSDNTLRDEISANSKKWLVDYYAQTAIRLKNYFESLT